MATKFKQKIAKIALISVLCKKSKKIFLWIASFSGFVNWSLLSKFSREQRELPWQPNFDKICKNCTYFSSVPCMETYAIKFFREQTTLLWQPNVGKSKP